MQKEREKIKRVEDDRAQILANSNFDDDDDGNRDSAMTTMTEQSMFDDGMDPFASFNVQVSYLLKLSLKIGFFCRKSRMKWTICRRLGSETAVFCRKIATVEYKKIESCLSEPRRVFPLLIDLLFLSKVKKKMMSPSGTG